MINLLILNKILVVLTTLSIGFLSLWVFLSNKKSKINKLFIFWAIFALSWIIFGYFANVIQSISLSLFFARLRFAAVSIFFIFAYFFSLFFYQKKEKYKLFNKLLIIICLSFMFLSIFTKFIIKDGSIENWGLELLFGNGIIAFYTILIFLTILIIFFLFKGYAIASRQEKTKIQYFLVGAFIFALMNLIFNIGFPLLLKTYRYYQFGDYSIIFLFTFMAYAIVKKQLFGIKIVLTQLFVGLIALLLLINTFVSESTFEYAWKGGLFIVFLVFGWLLVRSVTREIKQREQIDKYAGQLSVANVKLKKTYVKLQKLDKAKSEFISIASHQLRTPLTAIKGYISMILEGDYGKMPKESISPMHNVYASNERLIKLVNSLLDLSRLEAGKIKIAKAKFAVGDMLESIVLEFSSQAKKRGLKLTLVKPKEKIPLVNADQQKLRQVVANLIDNALKYTKQGSVRVILSKEKNNIKILIKDTGEGMTETELSGIFESFSRAGAGKRMFIEGAGLGLYVAKKFMALQNGKIWAESPGKGLGSTFHIELPVK